MLPETTRYDGVLVKTQHAYRLTTPTRLTPLGQQPSDTFDLLIGHVSVFFNTWQGEPRSTTVVATGNGRSVVATTGDAGPNDDPRILDLFADLITDAEQRETARLEPTVEALPHLGATRTEPTPPRPEPRLHTCSHRDNRMHDCLCAIGQDHGMRGHVLTPAS